MFKKQIKTGYSQAAAAAFITSGLIGVLPFLDIEISQVQAVNLGLFAASAIGWILRQVIKAKVEK